MRAPGNFHPADFDVLRRTAKKSLHGSIEAQGFLDRILFDS